MATSKIMSHTNLYFKNIQINGTTAEYPAKLIRQLFSVTTDAGGNAEVSVNYIRVLACAAVGDVAYLQVRKSAADGNDNTVINVKDKNFANRANINIVLLVTYLEY